MRGACYRMPKAAFDHDVGFQEGENEPQNLAVLDAALHPIHQHVMIDGVEAPLDIPLDHIPGPRRTGGCWVQLVLYSCERVMGASPGPKAIRDRIEIRLEDRLQHQLEGHLDQSVSERRYPQRTELSRLARLWDQPLPNRFWPVNSFSQLLPDLLQKTCDTIGSPFDRAFASPDPCPACCSPGYRPAVAKREPTFRGHTPC